MKLSYYSRKIIQNHKFHIQPNSTVLEIGSKNWKFLKSLNVKKGIGITNNKILLEKKINNCQFISTNLTDFNLKDNFDYIVISDAIGSFKDVQTVLEQVKKHTTQNTRIFITYYNFLWEGIIKIAETLGLKSKQNLTNWLSHTDMINLLELSDLEFLKLERELIVPINIPLISWFFNKYIAKLPLISHLCLIQTIIARDKKIEDNKELSVSIVVPARNEAGNINEIAKNIPHLGKGTELIFIEGGSKDNTWEEIKRIKKKYPNKNIICAQQDGKGKGNAVWKGFDMAKGDILMIFDADRTVPEKDLIKFYNAIASNKGEFIFGSRLVYPMQKDAMRFLNLLGNKFFSLAFSWVLNQTIKDTLCGTKVIKKELYQQLKKNRSYFGDFDPFGDFDLLFGSAKLNLKSIEIPIRYRARTYGETNISRFRHGWLLLMMVLFSLNKIKFK